MHGRRKKGKKVKGLYVNDHWQQMKNYLGDMLSVDGDGDAAVEARIRIG